MNVAGEKKSSASRKTVDKAMRILFAFSSAQPELPLVDLAARLGMHKSIASRLVSTLCEWRMLERDPATRRIRLGAGAWQLGTIVANQNVLSRIALPVLGELVQRTRQSAHVAVQDQTQMLVVATVHSPDALRVTMRQGDHRPLHATAAGKVMLAHMSAAVRHETLRKSGLPRLTPATITSKKQLESNLKQIRRSDIAWNDGESVQGVIGVAAPLRDASGDVIGALSCVSPQASVSTLQRTALAGEVRRSANAISALCGWNGDLNTKETRA